MKYFHCTVIFGSVGIPYPCSTKILRKSFYFANQMKEYIIRTMQYQTNIYNTINTYNEVILIEHKALYAINNQLILKTV